MMKQRLILLCGVLMSILTAEAQVEKHVEVSKAYVPSLEAATKLTIEPDMTDTMTLRPDIDYTVTPLSLQTTLATRPIRPATITYWEFNRPSPFYLKAGVGYPLQSVVELNASTQNSGTGYALGYLQHEGRYGRIRNDFGTLNYAPRMTNRVGGAAGYYLGKRIVEGELDYRHRMDCRYGMYYPKGMPVVGDRIGYSDANLRLRIGDDFLNLDRFNFSFGVDGSLFGDHSDSTHGEQGGRQLNLGADLRLARAWRKHSVALEAEYRYLGGRKALAASDEQLLGVGLRYAVKRQRSSWEAGATFYHDRVRNAHLTGFEATNYILPHVRFEGNIARKALQLFVTLDSHLETNDFRSLTEQNPYVQSALWLTKSSVNYDLKGGLKGSFGRDRFAYRLYATAMANQNHRYWVVPELREQMPINYFCGWMSCVQDDLIAFGLGGELNYRPTTSLNFGLEVLGRAFDDEMSLPHGESELTGAFSMRYHHPKFRLGVRAEVASERSWAVVSMNDYMQRTGTFEAPFAVDVQLDFEWIYSSSMTFFVEGRNLANQKIYHYPAYREYGINALVGVRMTF